MRVGVLWRLPCLLALLLSLPQAGCLTLCGRRRLAPLARLAAASTSSDDPLRLVLLLGQLRVEAHALLADGERILPRRSGELQAVTAGAGLLPEESRFQAGAAGSREMPRRRTAAAAWIPNLDS